MSTCVGYYLIIRLQANKVDHDHVILTRATCSGYVLFAWAKCVSMTKRVNILETKTTTIIKTTTNKGYRRSLKHLHDNKQVENQKNSCA